MARKNILWLVSWYPNRNDRFDGDFIQRHARAAALFNDIHVIFVTNALIEEDVVEEWNEDKGLTEQVIYFKEQKGIFKKVLKQMAWRKLYLNAVEDYIKKNGKPVCVHVHIPWKVGLIALWIKRRYKVPFIVTEHWGIYNNVVKDNIETRPSIVKRLLKKIFSGSEIFISVSRYLAESINAIVIKKDAVIIPNVVDTSVFCFSGKENSVFRFIHVSNMVPLKNVSGILQAAKILKDSGQDFELIMIGNRSNQYVAEAKEMDLLNTHVFFKGEIKYEDVANEMKRANAFILFSDIENSPCVISEALCCGLPVIATEAGGIPELINRENGIMVQPGNISTLTEAMERMLQEYHFYLKKNFAEQARIKFNYQRIGKMFDEIYNGG
jgi:glycosyltransferase involved in cell wall biosynthesis